ncbi:hypothetical protein IAR50_004173 [Cryptococcus sp. DSM 104548]
MSSIYQTPRSLLTQVGNWKLGPTLGRGAYAHVRLATHKNGHQAACKILPALHGNGQRPVTWDETMDAVEAHKEVVLLKALCGAGIEGIAGLEGVMEEEGWTYVFLTIYPRSVSSMPSLWTHDSLIIFFRRLLITTLNLHRLNVSHEDIKRSNVLATSKGLPILVDFGFSHFKADGGFVKSAGGTMEYSSPEKTADKMYDPKASDVWALGILLVKMIGLPHPFTHYSDDTSTTVKKRVVSGDPRFRWRPQGRIPGGVAELVMGMLEQDPSKRWTIDKILKHPYMKTTYPDPPYFKLPPYETATLHRPSQSVVEDLCFLAYMNGEFALCETSLRIEERLEGKDACWEKRWCGMLGAWSKIAEMDWQDIPAAITPLAKPRHTVRPVLSTPDPPRHLGSKPLKEIHLSPNIPRTSVHPSLALTDKKPVKPLQSRFYNMKSKNGDPTDLTNSQRSTVHQQAVRSSSRGTPPDEEAMSFAPANLKKIVLRIKKPKTKMNFRVFTSDSESGADDATAPDPTFLGMAKLAAAAKSKTKATKTPQGALKEDENETGRKKKGKTDSDMLRYKKSTSPRKDRMKDLLSAPSNDNNVTRRRSPRLEAKDNFSH